MVNSVIPQELQVAMWTEFFTGRTVELCLLHQNLTPIAVTLDAAADTLTATAHGLIEDDEVILSADGGAGVPPPELELSLPYRVVNATTDTVQLASGLGGSPIDFSTAGSGMLYLKKLVWGRNATTAEILATELTVGTNGYARQAIDLSTNVTYSEAENAYLYKSPTPIVITPSGGDLTFDSIALLDITNSIAIHLTWDDSSRTMADGTPLSFPVELKIASGDYATGTFE